MLDEEISYILAHLESPEKLTLPEFRNWLAKDGHRELFEEIFYQREAFMRLRDTGKIETEREYRRFKKKIRLRNHSWLKWTSVAACLAVGFTLLFTFREMSEERGTDPSEGRFAGKKSAELVLADGERVQLENKTMELRERNGIRITNDSCCRLSYRQDSPNKKPSDAGLVFNEVSVPAGADYLVELSDGTTVRLNCETKLRFPVEFAENERRVFLEGEAFFEVEKEAGKWPFIVVTDGIEVEVTGTAFNIKSYRSEELIQTTLVRGSVQVRCPDLQGSSFRLRPSQQHNLNRNTREALVKEVDASLYTDWIEGRFVFKNQRLEDIMNTLARWYTVEVFYSDHSAKDLRISANLGRYDHIDSLLQVIIALYKAKIERKDRVLIIR